MNDFEQGAIKLLERNRVGALLRVYSYTPEAVDEQVSSAIEALKRLLVLRAGDRAVFSRIDFLVSSDQDFEDADCGLTAEALRNAVHTEFLDAPVTIFEIKKGDVNCMLLNYGVANQLEDRISYSMILSHSAASFATQETAHRLLAAMYNRARVCGVAMDTLAPFVRKGLIMNTFAMWHNKSLMTVGGFDLLAAKPRIVNANEKEKVTSFSDVKASRHGDGTVEYLAAGCEEIIPLTRLVDFFGPCISVVEPTGEDMSWKEFDKDTNELAYNRHLAKMATKQARIEYMAATQGRDISFIEKGLVL